MRQLTITQEHLEELVLESLKQDLENITVCGTEDKEAKKQIKALKRVINFYSINPPYPENK